MEITEAQYHHIERCLPTPCGNVTLDNLQVLNAILYVAEQGCKWRGLPKRFGNWHMIYTRMNRCPKSGVLHRVFVQLQQAQILRVKLEAVALDSTAYQSQEGMTWSAKGQTPVVAFSDQRQSVSAASAISAKRAF